MDVLLILLFGVLVLAYCVSYHDIKRIRRESARLDAELAVLRREATRLRDGGDL